MSLNTSAHAMILQILLLTLSLLSFGCYLWLQARKYRHFPGSLGFPVLGNLFQCLNSYCHLSHSSFFEHVERTIDKYGKISTLWLSNKVALAVADPFIAEKLIFNPTLGDKPQDVYAVLRIFMCNTTTMQTCKEWKLRRKELKNYLKKSYIESYHSTFLDAGNKAVEILSQETKQFDCLSDIMLLNIEIAAKALYGLDLTLTDHALSKDIHRLHIIASATLNNSIIRTAISIFGEILNPFKHERKLVRTLYEGVLQKLNESKADEVSDNENIKLASIIAFRNAARNTLGKELFLELTELIYSSSLTIGSVLATALVYLGTNPHVQDKVWQEQRDIFGDSEREPTAEDIEKMEYLERFFKEVCRFVSPPFSVKEALEDTTIDDMAIPKGTLILLCSRKMRFVPKFWSNPDSFDPDRHLPENLAQVPKCANILFGYGIRVCPGIVYATYVFKVILSSIVRKLEINSIMKFDEIKYRATTVMDIIGGHNIYVKKRNAM